MSVPSVELMLVAGRAVFLVFSFVFAAVTFTAWRRATRAQTEQVLAQHGVVLQRLAELEARVELHKSLDLAARRAHRAPATADLHRLDPCPRVPDRDPARQGGCVARGAHRRLWPVVARGRPRATFAQPPQRLTKAEILMLSSTRAPAAMHNEELTSISCTGPLTCFAAGGSNYNGHRRVIGTTDGGANWTTILYPGRSRQFVFMR